MTTFKKALLLAICLSLASCSWLKTNEKTLSADVIALVGCVSSALLAGQTVETVATATCSPLAVNDVVALADTLNITPTPSPALTTARLAKTTTK